MSSSPTFRVGTSSRSQKKNLVTTKSRKVQQASPLKSNSSSGSSTSKSSDPAKTAMRTVLMKENKGFTKNETAELCDLNPRFCMNNGICSVNIRGEMQCWSVSVVFHFLISRLDRLHQCTAYTSLMYLFRLG